MVAPKAVIPHRKTGNENKNKSVAFRGLLWERRFDSAQPLHRTVFLISRSAPFDFRYAPGVKGAARCFTVSPVQFRLPNNLFRDAAKMV